VYGQYLLLGGDRRSPRGRHHSPHQHGQSSPVYTA
jgi:hypothetical protein